MAYDDEDDLFGEEFDFVDEDDDDAEGSSVIEEDDQAKPTPKKRPPARDKDKADRPPARAPKRPAKPPAAAGKREPRREPIEPKAPAPPAPPAPVADAAPVGYIMDDSSLDEEPSEIEAEPAAASGPPADHVVHIYEYGDFKRTIARKFTDEQAVSFAEEYTRLGKAYGRYAIATPDDEVPAPTFAGAAKG